MAPKRRDRDGDSTTKVTTEATSNGAATSGSGNSSASSSSATAALGVVVSGGMATANGNGSVVQMQPTYQLPLDQEIFLQAFEKPTQIYRYLRTRNMISPVFLHRNLTYMKERSRRPNRSRSFQVNSLLAIKQQQLLRSRTENGSGATFGNGMGEYMTLMFLGYHDKSVTDDDVRVEVETNLSHISHKKRKESSNTLQEQIGVSVVKVNPEDSAAACLSKVPAVSVAKNSFHSTSGGNDSRKSYVLQLNVTVKPRTVDHHHSQHNHHLHHHMDLDLDVSDANDAADAADERRMREPLAKRARSGSTQHTIYESELVVYDKQSRCMLTDGEYELELKERPANSVKCTYSPKKHPTWETIPDMGIASMDKTAFDDFHSKPVLKFRLAWTKERCAPFVDRPLPITVIKKHQPQVMVDAGGALAIKPVPDANGDHALVAVDNNNTKIAVTAAGDLDSPAKLAGVDYVFFYSNNTRQQTQVTDDYQCPWCSLNCCALYALLKHLKLCHARFNFTYVPREPPAGQLPRARIDVCINELFDGSYTGSPNDMVGPSGQPFSRNGPMQQSVVTRILVCRPRRSKPTLNEFLEIDENELNSQRPYISGHNRLYHHTMTCLPVHPKELDIDSEGESDPAWLQHKTMMMIDEFTDVNEGEKELMKMWNLHIMKNGYVGDIQIPLACDMFLDLHGRELLAKNLYKNFIMHMCNLSDYGLVSAEAHFKVVQKLQRMLTAHEIGRQTLAASRLAQLQHWKQFGLARQQQKLLDEREAKTKKTAMPSASVPGSANTRTTTSATSSSSHTSTSSSSLPPRLTPNRSDSAAAVKAAKNNPLPGSSITQQQATKQSLRESKSRENKPNRNSTSTSGTSSGGGGGSAQQPGAAGAAAAAAPISNKRRFSHLRDSTPAPPPTSSLVRPRRVAATNAARLNYRRRSISSNTIADRRHSQNAAQLMLDRRTPTILLSRIDDVKM